MSLFDLEWFKRNHRIQELKQEFQKELEKGRNSIPPYPGSTTPTEGDRPYKNIKLVNDVLTIVLNDGNVISKTNATLDDFQMARDARTEEQLFNICISPEAMEDKLKRDEEIARAKAILEGIEKLKSYPNEFVVEGNTVRFKGIDRTLPQLMVEEILLIIDGVAFPFEYDGYLAIKRFFMWCCLNPRPEVANELYRFMRENSFRITKQGFFVALRNVVTLHGSNELVQFVSNAYNKIKAVWKEDPTDYRVFLKNGQYDLVHRNDIYQETTEECDDCNTSGRWYDEWDEVYHDCENCDGSGYIQTTKKMVEGEDLGCLTDLYLDLPNRHENRFTDDWTKTFDIRIGQPVTMPQEDCNWSTQDCAAAGLHFTADQIHYVGCGDQSVLVLINPMKVVGIGEHKGRCYEYLPIMTVPREEATKILHDATFDTLQLDEQFAVDQLNNLELLAQEGFVIEASKHEFYMPQISISEIKGIVRSLEEMKSELSGRVRNI
jgi:hypothetical protein